LYKHRNFVEIILWVYAFLKEGKSRGKRIEEG
jgi:hypothetical protein